ncbi:MAG: hypothetical protein Q9219_000172 [cf. Caloplaca sp. 3 TL-2023]
MASDPLDALFELENTFYKEGYDLGVEDGSRAGRIEGRLFGLEKGFEKYVTMGKLHGRSVIWSKRMSSPKDQESGAINNIANTTPAAGNLLPASSGIVESASEEKEISSRNVPMALPKIEYNPRLEKHIRTLYALTEPASLGTENSEETVSEFDDRLKRAEGKVKIIEKLVDEEAFGDGQMDASEVTARSTGIREDGIENTSVSGARR